MMECQDVRQLLAFHERPRDVLDAEERDAIQKHLDACPECASLAQSDHAADQAIGTALRDVPVPAGLKLQMLKRLAEDRSAAGRGQWKRLAYIAAAAVLLIGATTTAIVYPWPKSPFIPSEDHYDFGKASDVENYLTNHHGLAVDAPANFRYRLLRQIDVVSVNGGRVAKLVFRRDDDNTSADVYIVDTRKFSVADLEKANNHRIAIEAGPEGSPFICVIYHPGGPWRDWLLQPTGA